MAPLKARVLQDLTKTNVFAKQLQERMNREEGEKIPRKFEGSPYEEPEIIDYIVKKGKYEGKRKFVLQFRHKANPAWSRSYDITDLTLLTEHMDALKPALEALKTVKE